MDRAIAFADRFGDALRSRARLGLVERAHRAERQVARHFAGAVAAEAVGHGEHVVACEAGVLVAFADAPHVGQEARTHLNRSAHERRTSAIVLPTLISSPTAIGEGLVTFTRLRYVPFVEPRSSTNHVPSFENMRACSVDTYVSSS